MKVYIFFSRTNPESRLPTLLPTDPDMSEIFLRIFFGVLATDSSSCILWQYTSTFISKSCGMSWLKKRRNRMVLADSDAKTTTEFCFFYWSLQSVRRRSSKQFNIWNAFTMRTEAQLWRHSVWLLQCRVIRGCALLACFCGVFFQGRLPHPPKATFFCLG